MKIALFGATGTIGRRILDEALSRGHQVSAIARDASRTVQSAFRLRTVRANILDPQSVAGAALDHDIVVNAFGPRDQSPKTLVAAAWSLMVGLRMAGVNRLVVVGGAGSLELTPGVQLVDAPTFPRAWKPVALAHREALEVYRKEARDLSWTYVSPAALVTPGKRTGRFRLGTEQLVMNAKGHSEISAEDFAIAVLDEVEQPRHIRQRFTAAY